MVDPEAQPDEGLILLLGEIPHAHRPPVDVPAEVTAFAIGSGGEGFEVRRQQLLLKFFRQVEPPASVHFAVEVFGSVVQIRFLRQGLPGEIGHFDVHGAFVALPVVRRGGIGFPVQITRLVNRAVEVQVKMTSLERAVLQNLVAVVGAVTDIIMQDELVNGLL